MDDFSAVKVGQAVQNALCNLPQDLFSCSTTQFPNLLVYTVQTSSLTKLHRYRYRTRRLIHEGTVVAADMVRCAVLIEVEFSNNLLLHIGIWICRDNLRPGKRLANGRWSDSKRKDQRTFKANTVFPSLSLQRVTAPPAPSPRLPNSTIFPRSLAASQPSSSKSSASRGLPFSRLSLSKSGKRPLTLLSRSMATVPSRSE